MKIKSKINKLICLSLLSSSFSCSIPGFDSQSGFIHLGFKFPKSNNFSIKSIPQETEKIEIKITGEGIPTDTPIIQNISRQDSIYNNEEIKKTIKDIPTGTKTVEIKALDNKDIVLAKALTSTINKDGNTIPLTIEKGKVTQLTITLDELLKSFKLGFNDYPSDGFVGFAEIKPSSGPSIYEKFEGKELSLKKIPLGETKIKVSIFRQDATPLSVAETTINVETTDKIDTVKSINLEKIVLPDLSNSTFTPEQLILLIKKVMIRFPGNKEPVINGVKILVNGIEKPFSNITPICVNQGDNFNISIDSVDPDGDELNYFWVRTTALSGGIFKSQLQTEKTGNISGDINFEIGNTALGFILTDKKSYSGPLSIQFKVSSSKCL